MTINLRGYDVRVGAIRLVFGAGNRVVYELSGDCDDAYRYVDFDTEEAAIAERDRILAAIRRDREAEVWMRAACAALSRPGMSSVAALEDADAMVKHYNTRYGVE